MIHKTAEVSEKAKIGKDVKIWNWVQIREDAVIGDHSILSKGVYVDFDVKIGKNVKIQNNVSVYHLMSELNSLEPGWGGKDTVIGSPRTGTALSKEQLLSIVLEQV